MAMPTDVGIIDTMIDFPHGDMKALYKFITDNTHDKESKDDFEFPVEYMFKDVPDKQLRDVADPIAVTLEQIAESTNAAAYDASNPATISKVFTAVVSNF